MQLFQHQPSDLSGKSPSRQLIGFIRAFGKHHYLVVVASLTAIIVAALEAGLMGLLLPFIRGFIEGDFTLIRNSQVYESIANWIPSIANADSKTAFILFSGLLILLAAGKNACAAVRTFSLLAYGDIFTTRLRHAIFNRILGCGTTFLEQNQSGRLQNVLLSYPELVSQSLQQISAALSSAVMLVTYAATMLYLSWQLLLAMVISLPFLLFSSRIFSTRLTRLSLLRAPWASEISAYGLRMLNAFTLIQLSNRKEDESRNFEQKTLAYRSYSLKQNVVIAFIEPFQEIVSFFFLASLVGVYAFYFTSESAPLISASRFIVFFLVLKRALVCVGIITNARNIASVIAGPLNEIAELFDNENKYPLLSGNRRLEQPLTKGIRLQHLNYTYKSGMNIRDISIELSPGEILAIVGRSGAGKSTLIKVLARLYDIPRGNYFWDGIDVTDLATETLYKQIGLVSQEPIILPASFRENLAYEARHKTFSDSELWSILERIQLKSLVESMPNGLDTLIGERGSTLSGGERQRLAIGRTILKEASLLLFDEATSALDSITEKVIHQELLSLGVGRTTIMVAHRLATIQHASRVIVMNEGTIIESGSIQELRKSGKVFSELWQSQDLKKTG